MQELTPEQRQLQLNRLTFEETEWRAVRSLSEIKGLCKEHVVIRGWLRWSPVKQTVVETEHSDSASCSICGVDLGWWCPENPKGYCEYDDKSENCIFCHQPDERK